MKTLMMSASLLAATLASATSSHAMGSKVAPWGKYPVTGVAPGVFRGGRPAPDAWDFMKDIGVKTVIDLENDPSFVEPERRYFETNGIGFVNFGMDSWHEPDQSGVNNLLSIISDPTKQPVYVHCEHGMDRTGLIIGLYRVKIEGWDPRDAFNEMRKYQFHPFLMGLYQSFVHNTGYNPYHLPIL